jgi:hypothetical protein
MSWNSSKPLLAVLVLFLLTGSSLPQVPDDRRPKSILDYYLLLPQKYLPYLTADSRPVREAAIQSKDLDGASSSPGWGIYLLLVSKRLLIRDRSDQESNENGH